MTALSALPRSVLGSVFEFVPTAYLRAVCCTCRVFREAVRERPFLCARTGRTRFYSALRQWAEDGVWRKHLHAALCGRVICGRSFAFVMFSVACRTKDQELFSHAMELCDFGSLRLLRLCSHACSEAARWGCVGFLKALVRAGYLCPSLRAMVNAAKYGHLSCLRYMMFDERFHRRGLRLSRRSKVCKAAAANGRLGCVKLMLQNGARREGQMLVSAARHGHIECVSYLLKVGVPASENAAIAAAEEGHLRCLALLRGFWQQHNQSLVRAPLRKDQVHCFSYLLNCELDPVCFGELATWCVKLGASNCLRYLIDVSRDNVLPRFLEENRHNDEHCRLAIRKGNDRCLAVLLNSGFHCSQGVENLPPGGKA